MCHNNKLLGGSDRLCSEVPGSFNQEKGSRVCGIGREERKGHSK